MSDRRRHRDEAMGKGLTIPGRWLQVMSPTEAVLLAFLDRTACRKNAEQFADGWFQCDGRLIEKMIGMPTGTQTRLIGQLVERGLLETERRGQGARRWLRINWQAVAKIVE